MARGAAAQSSPAHIAPPIAPNKRRHTCLRRRACSPVVTDHSKAEQEAQSFFTFHPGSEEHRNVQS
jgi:hypothetical protein